MSERRPLSPLRRLALEAEVLSLASRAIRLRHPKGKALGILRAEHYDDEGLIEIAFRLDSWISRQDGSKSV